MKQKLVRPNSLVVGTKSLSLPVFFPSVSSVKTTLKPIDYMQILSMLTDLNSQYLVSAFDLSRTSDPIDVGKVLQSAVGGTCVTLMDSGNYESYWKDAKSYWTQSKFHHVMDEYPCDLAFCFDEQSPPSDSKEHVDLVISRWRDDQQGRSCLVVPIIHGEALDFPDLCFAVADQSGVPMIAVPERHLGAGVFERAKTIKAIRNKLNELDRYVVLHLLGTGNPTSIAIYTYMGADSFDGLEWCQTVVDHETALLYHLSQADFFANQTPWGDEEFSFQVRTLAHNLVFYSEWMSRLRQASLDCTLVRFCRENFEPRIFSQCEKEIGWSE